MFHHVRISRILSGNIHTAVSSREFRRHLSNIFRTNEAVILLKRDLCQVYNEHSV